MKKIIIIVLAVLLLVGGSIGGTLFLTGAFDKTEEVEGEDEAGEDGEGETEGDGKSKKKKKGKDGEPLETYYYNFQPEFVVNFGVKARPKFLMLEVSISTYDEAVPDLLDKHTPALRNELLNTFSTQTSAELATTEGKDELRKKTHEAIQNVMDEHYGDDAIEDVFFTRFVMQ